MKKIFGGSDSNYTAIIFWFEAAYVIGLLTVGRTFDWIGTRLGFALAMIFWSAASLLHAGMLASRDSRSRASFSGTASRAISPRPLSVLHLLVPRLTPAKL